MANGNCIILAPMKMEASAIAPVLGNFPLQVIGIGAKILDPGLVEEFDRIILAGLGGALDPQLNIGDVVVEGDSGFIPSPCTQGEGEGGGRIRAGKIFPSDHLISSVEEKQKIFRETGCLAVDMESHVVRKQCEAAGKEFIHIRAISDKADEALPERIASWVDEVGEPKMAKVSAELMFRPSLLPVLMRLQSNSKLALKNLADAIKSIVGTMSHS